MSEEPQGTIIVNHPKFGDLEFPAGMSPEAMTAAVHQLEVDGAKGLVEAGKAVATAPALKEKEAFNARENAPLYTMENFKRGASAAMKWLGEHKGEIAGEALQMGGPAIAQRFLGPVGGAVAGGASNVIGSMMGGQPVTPGGVGQAMIRGATSARTGDLIGNAARLGAAEVAGAAYKDIADAGPAITSLMEKGDYDNALALAGNAMRNGVNAATIMATLDKGKFSATEKKRMKDDLALIDTMNGGRELGLVLDPSLYGASKAKSADVRVAGQTAFHKDASIKNAPIVTEVARNEVGIDGALSKNAFFTKKTELQEPYREAKKLSPAASDAVQAWEEANAEANRLTRRALEVNDPQARKQAKELRKEADAHFLVIENEAKRLGTPGLVDDIRAARIKLAQLGAVKAATNEAVGRVDGAILGMMYDDGVPFTGNLEKVARTAAAMPAVFKDPKGLSNAGRNIAMAGTGATVAAAGSALGSAAAAPVGAGMATMPPIMRYLMQTNAYQNANAVPRYQTQSPDTLANLMRFASLQEQPFR